MVELLVPELQRRGVYWNDYPAPEGTFRENLQCTPGQPLIRDDHPAALFKWNVAKSANGKEEPMNGNNGENEMVTGVDKLNLTPTVKLTA